MWVLLIFSFLFSLSKIDGEQYPSRFEGVFEEYGNNRVDLIAKFLPDNPVVFEAGGHYGCDTVKFAKKWPQGTIISFEPNPHAFSKLLETTKNLDNVYAHNFAVNNYNGIAILNVCHGSFGDNLIYEGASSLLEASEWMEIHYQGPKLEVSCVVLDDWCQANGIDHLDFMWLDLEGLELQVLKSSPKILTKVKVIYAETNFLKFRKGMTQFKDLKNFLERAGFQMLSHWYAEGFQGDAIFIKKELFGKFK